MSKQQNDVIGLELNAGSWRVLEFELDLCSTRYMY